MSWVVRINKRIAEAARRELQMDGLLDRSRALGKDGEFVLIPVNLRVDNFPCVEMELPAAKRKQNSLEALLKGKLPKETIARVSKRFDIIGTVAVLELNGLSKAEELIVAEALRTLYPHLTAVAKKTGIIENEYRVRPVELIIGESTRTLYTEFGVRMKLDVAKVYFSPRLATERLRIAEQVRPHERVLVMFAGAGPYALLIAKKQPLAKVAGVELNQAGVDYFKQNILLNHQNGRVEALEGDVRTVVPTLGKFDRIVMPLPKDAGDFLDVAVSAAAPNAVVHFYGFAAKEDLFSAAEEKLKNAGFEVFEKRICGNIGPGQFRIVLDARLNVKK